jgi:hypothetical protein
MSSKFNPAFPPQIAQDNFGRVLAPLPGMSKLEYFSLTLLPYFMELSLQIDFDPIKKSIETAETLITELDKIKPNESDTSIIKQ